MKALRLVEPFSFRQVTQAPAAVPEKEGRVSVVVVSYHTGPVLWRCIESVLSQNNLHELVLVDNGNTEDVATRLAAFSAENPKLHIIQGQGNVGFAKGCNLGAGVTTGEYILLLNPDCILFPNTLSSMVDALAAHPEAWMAGCSLLSAKDYAEQQTCRRNLLTPLTALVESFSLHRFLPESLANTCRLNNHIPQTAYVPAISGAFMMLPKQRYLTLGGMDESYFLHVEDMDFCLSIHDHGGKILYVPEVKAVHFLSTSDAPSHFIEWNKTKGFFRYFQKNFCDAYSPYVLPLLYAAISARFCIKTALNGVKSFYLNGKKHSTERHAKLLGFWNQPLFTRTSAQLSGIKTLEPVLVTGATSQVGICLLRRLLAADIKTTGQFCSSVVDFTHPQLSWLHANLDHALNLQGAAPKTVVHAAPLWLLNPHIKALAEAGVKRIVAFSSTSVFGKNNSKNAYERQVVEKLQQAEEMLAAECDAHHIQWTILRPTMVYGLGMDTNISAIVRFIKRFGFFPVASDAEGLRAPVHADDLALAALTALNEPATFGKSYNLPGGEVLPYDVMVKRLFQAIEKKPRVVRVPFLPFLLDAVGFLTRKKHFSGEIARRMADDLVFDRKPAESDFGYCPRGFLKTEPGAGIN